MEVSSIFGSITEYAELSKAARDQNISSTEFETVLTKMFVEQFTQTLMGSSMMSSGSSNGYSHMIEDQLSAYLTNHIDIFNLGKFGGEK